MEGIRDLGSKRADALRWISLSAQVGSMQNLQTMQSHGDHSLFFCLQGDLQFSIWSCSHCCAALCCLRHRLGAVFGHVSCMTTEHTQLEVEAVLMFLSSESVVFS